jgi:hypothetical protein
MHLSLGIACNWGIFLRSLSALIHRVVAGDLEGLAICRRVLRGRRLLGQDKELSFPINALKQLAAGRRGRPGIMIENPKGASRCSGVRSIDGRSYP